MQDGGGAFAGQRGAGALPLILRATQDCGRGKWSLCFRASTFQGGDRLAVIGLALTGAAASQRKRRRASGKLTRWLGQWVSARGCQEMRKAGHQGMTSHDS